MRISLIGMSNIGKSHLARHLAGTHGYEHINCDRLIEHKLTRELAGHKSLTGLAKWMGFPFDPQYKKNSDLYLNAESEAMRQILAKLNQSEKIPAAIDTTGSVIYCGDEILNGLRAATTVVCLDASENHLSTLFKNYVAHPKPVIWGDIYQPRADETQAQSLQRCYAELLLYRMQHYKKIAHIVIPYEQHQNHKKEIWGEIEKQISRL